MDQPKQAAEPETKPEQQLDFYPEGIAYRQLVRDIDKQLGSRYIKECSKADKIETSRLVKGGMKIPEAKQGLGF